MAVVPWGVGTDIHVPDSDVSVLSVFFSCDREVTKHVAHEASVTGGRGGGVGSLYLDSSRTF